MVEHLEEHHQIVVHALVLKNGLGIIVKHQQIAQKEKTAMSVKIAEHQQVR